MTTYATIPARPGVQQRFNVSLNGKTYIFQLIYRIDTWFLDVMDVNANPLVCGIPLVTGADLFAQYPELGFGGRLQVGTVGASPDQPPTFTGLGVQSQMYWIQ